MEIEIDQLAKGVRIICGEQMKRRRTTLNKLIEIAENSGFEEILIPSIEPTEIYVNKAGAEVLGQMYVFPDKKNRSLCLRPECTATVQLIAEQKFKRYKNLKLWYFEKCWRYERQQYGRYREFFQFGLEVINPSSPKIRDELIDLAKNMVEIQTHEYVIATNVKRGLDYYTEDGFEISAPQLRAQKQIVGGGAYKQGIGFAIGFDRLMLCN